MLKNNCFRYTNVLGKYFLRRDTGSELLGSMYLPYPAFLAHSASEAKLQMLYWRERCKRRQQEQGGQGNGAGREDMHYRASRGAQLGELCLNGFYATSQLRTILVGGRGRTLSAEPSCLLLSPVHMHSRGQELPCTSGLWYQGSWGRRLSSFSHGEGPRPCGGWGQEEPHVWLSGSGGPVEVPGSGFWCYKPQIEISDSEERTKPQEQSQTIQKSPKRERR